jgi:hypothetical protein
MNARYLSNRTLTARFVSNLTLGLLAGFLVVATMSFAPASVAWITFGIAIAATVVGLSMAGGIRDLAQRGLGALVAVIAIWTIVASLVFVPTTVVWLGFASALALVGLAVAGLIEHELRAERVVHSLEVAPQRAHEPEQQPVA